MFFKELLHDSVSPKSKFIQMVAALTIFMNLVLYPHYGVWTSMTPLFGWMERGDSFIQCLSQHSLGYLSKTPSDRCKIRGPQVPTMVPYKPQSCSLTSAASPSHILTCTSPGLQLSLVSLCYRNRVTLYSWIPP